jgi:heme-degrading monooxygenase HmoA
MFLQQVQLAVLDGQQAAFESALLEVRRRVFQSRGFRGFTVAQGVERPARYLVQVSWESAEELADVTESGRFERCWAPVEPFLRRPLLLDHLVELPGLGFQGPGASTDFDLAWQSE